MEPVYEIGRTFRNEGISPKYNPEFTMLEAYQAYGTYEDMMDLTEGLVKASAEAVNGSRTDSWRGTGGDLDRPWPPITLHDAVAEAVGRDRTTATPVEGLP